MSAKRRRRPPHDEQPWFELTAHEPRERRRVSSEMRLVYVVLGAIVLAAVVASVFFRQNPWVDRFAPSVATDSFGILLTLVFVHRFLERQERSRRLRGSTGALRRGSRALQEMADAWAQLVKGALPDQPRDPVPTALDLLTPHFGESVVAADPQRVRDDGETWVQWCARRLAAARRELNRTVEAYSGSLDPAYVEAADAVVDDEFSRLFEELAGAGVEARDWRVRMFAARAARETTFARLRTAIAVHNVLAGEAAGVRSRHIGPRTGMFGIELPPDHDLRVHVELAPDWWDADPRPGSLRAQTEPVHR